MTEVWVNIRPWRSARREELRVSGTNRPEAGS